MNKLTGKVALITGAARGIGNTIAELFLAEGASVALCDINRDGVQAAAAVLARGGGTARAYEMNVTDEKDVSETVQTIFDEMGSIDILVNNAGITRDKLMIRMNKEDWDSVISVNLTGAFNVAKAVARGMLKSRFGHIINIASVVGVVGNAGQANYSASKAGLIGLTKSMAKEFALRGITVNAVAPGYIHTEMTENLPVEAKQAFLNAIPLKRAGTPLDVARVAVFLASADASYITGQVICVDGGLVM